MKIRGEGLWKEGRCGAGAAVVCKRQITIKEPSDEQKSRSCVSFVDMVYGNPLGLPRLPIPTLQDTVKRYLQVFDGACMSEILTYMSYNLDRDHLSIENYSSTVP